MSIESFSPPFGRSGQSHASRSFQRNSGIASSSIAPHNRAPSPSPPAERQRQQHQQQHRSSSSPELFYTVTSDLRDGFHYATTTEADFSAGRSLEIHIQIRRPSPNFLQCQTCDELLHFKDDHPYQHPHKSSKCLPTIENIHGPACCSPY